MQLHICLCLSIHLHSFITQKVSYWWWKKEDHWGWSLCAPSQRCIDSCATWPTWVQPWPHVTLIRDKIWLFQVIIHVLTPLHIVPKPVCWPEKVEIILHLSCKWPNSFKNHLHNDISKALYALHTPNNEVCIKWFPQWTWLRIMMCQQHSSHEQTYGICHYSLKMLLGGALLQSDFFSLFSYCKCS